jgi:hypothetical protein
VCMHVCMCVGGGGGGGEGGEGGGLCDTGGLVRAMTWFSSRVADAEAV